VAKFLPTLILICLLTWILPEQILAHSRLNGAPPVMLWAWERPEDIRGFSDSANVGVAYLAATLNISDADLNVHARRQPFLHKPDLYVLPVVRIETDRKKPPSFSSEQIELVVAQIIRLAANSHARGLQIDFDATKDQRQSYKKILSRLRRLLPPEMPLSITAIASWCAGDYWLSSLPVDEVVPMYFDMGVNQAEKWQYYQYVLDSSRNSLSVNCKCHSAIGLSINETVPFSATAYKGKRVYFFSRHPWQTVSNQEKNDITKILKYTEAS
jgi:hypothetical protein